MATGDSISIPTPQGFNNRISVPQPFGPKYPRIVSFTTLSDFPPTGVLNRIYLAQDTSKSYSWNGSKYVQLVPTSEIDGGKPTSTYTPLQKLDGGTLS